MNIKTGISGLGTHIRHKHTDTWDAINRQKTPSTNSDAGQQMQQQVLLPNDSNVSAITHHYLRGLTVEERKKAFLGADIGPLSKTSHSQPLKSLLFCKMFDAYSPDADKIVSNVNPRPRSFCENVCLYEKFAKEATWVQTKRHKGTWMGDHWTSPTNETYSSNIFHYIKDWEKCNLLLDLEIHYGSTKGKILYDHQKKVLDLGADVTFVFTGVLDTTGNMGVLSQEVR